ncbi:MAG: hypothetical protein HRT35_29470 [Algicola sp.]|nr:hypothetical protein [Algicola sp.]
MGIEHSKKQKKQATKAQQKLARAQSGSAYSGKKSSFGLIKLISVLLVVGFATGALDANTFTDYIALL